MDLLKKMYPITAKDHDVSSLVVAIVIYAVTMIITGVICGLLVNIPILGALTSIAAFTVELYCTGGIVISVFTYLGKI